MNQQRPATPTQILVFGLITAAIGGYFALVGGGLLPIPGGPANLHAPLWVLFCVGLAFLLAGIALLVQRFGRADARGELPADAPPLLRVIQYLTGVAIFVSFALIGSWVAFGPGERAFSGTLMFPDARTNEILGRALFGVGAIISWACAVAFAVWRARRLFGRRAG